MADAATTMKLKLFINMKTKKVAFAEAGKDFVDFLFSLMVMPIGCLTRLVSKDNMAGSLGNIYQSVHNLEDGYMQRKEEKQFLVDPSISFIGRKAGLLLKDVTPKKYYICPNPSCWKNISEVKSAMCSCRSPMCTELRYSFPDGSGAWPSAAREGFVMAAMIYMVMDDLVVTPLTVMDLLREINANNGVPLLQKTIQVDMEEGLALLKASIQSTTVLTDVFRAEILAIDRKKLSPYCITLTLLAEYRNWLLFIFTLLIQFVSCAENLLLN